MAGLAFRSSSWRGSTFSSTRSACRTTSGVVQWVLNPHWQFFCGEEFFQHKLPIHPSQMTRWRKRIGEAGMEKLLQLTIEAGKRTKTVTEKSVEKVIVGTTVQPKAIQHPTDARLYRKVRAAMADRCAGGPGTAPELSKTDGVGLSHMKAKQFKRARKVLRRLKTMAGRVMRDVERKLSDEGYEAHKGAMILSELILEQKRNTKNKVTACMPPRWSASAKGRRTGPTSSA